MLGAPIQKFSHCHDVVAGICPPLQYPNTVTFTSSDNGLSSLLMPLWVFLRVIVTGVLADRKPVDLHLFRNYESPSSVLGIGQLGFFKPTFSPEEQLIWRAARATGAAPSYFR
jgi:hypothetical protein